MIKIIALTIIGIVLITIMIIFFISLVELLLSCEWKIFDLFKKKEKPVNLVSEKEIEEPYIGEVYKNLPFFDCGGNQAFCFVRFKQSDIEDEHDGYYKIFGTFYKEDRILFYDSIYDTKRKQIRKRFENKEK